MNKNDFRFTIGVAFACAATVLAVPVNAETRSEGVINIGTDLDGKANSRIEIETGPVIQRRGGSSNSNELNIGVIGDPDRSERPLEEELPRRHRRD